MAAPRIPVSRILRIVGFMDFLVAMACLTIPVVRARLGEWVAAGIAVFLLVGSAGMFWVARRTDRMAAGKGPS